jgi:predicted dehydrogenase
MFCAMRSEKQRPAGHGWTRRKFLSGAAAGAAWSLAGVNVVGANGKLRHASIGVGGMMGFQDLNKFAAHPRLELAALCDVDAAFLEKAGELAPGAKRYRDWREMLAQEGDRIDSVSITVPDHMHAPITLEALRRGKHVYCQKPLTHDVFEARVVARAAQAAGKVTQLGTQFAAGAGDRMAVELLQQGVLGKIRRVALFSNRPGAVEKYRLPGPRPQQGSPVPGNLAWDLWLGTAPVRDYAEGIYHPSCWRCWIDFGTGWSGDIGCHLFDAVWKGLDLKAPKTVQAKVQDSWAADPARQADNWPQADHVTWVFPGNEKTDGDLTVEWFDGEYFPPEELRKLAVDFENFPSEGAMVLGTDGAMLLPHQSAPRLYPLEKFRAVPRPQIPGTNHYHDFVDACLGGAPARSDFPRTGPMAEAILLGTAAIRAHGRLLEWEPETMDFRNDPAARAFLRRAYRKGWEVADLG